MHLATSKFTRAQLASSERPGVASRSPFSSRLAPLYRTPTGRKQAEGGFGDHVCGSRKTARVLEHSVQTIRCECIRASVVQCSMPVAGTGPRAHQPLGDSMLSVCMCGPASHRLICTSRIFTVTCGLTNVCKNTQVFSDVGILSSRTQSAVKTHVLYDSPDTLWI